MVTFRLSCEEYETYRAACPAAGVRSLSELARTAMHQLVAVRNGTPPMDDQLRELRQQVQLLSREVRRIGQELEDLFAAQQTNGAGPRTKNFSLASH